MQKILACIDARGNTDAVIDWAAWAALRLGAPLEFLHVLERHPEHALTTDFSGTLEADAQTSLLQALSGDDERRSRERRGAGRELLAHARARAAAAGADRLDARLRHGEFVETAIELQHEAGLLVLGEHSRDGGAGRLQPDHHVERVIRGVTCSVLVATADAYEAPQRVVIAYDGSPAARKALSALAGHPLVAGLPVHVLMVAPDSPAARQQLKEGQAALKAAGVAAETELAEGDAQAVLPARVKLLAPALLVTGAFGHSRLREWVLGSTTKHLLRASDVPVLILR
jgi:nucleotide-binding universal stress UspA family protein